MSHKYSYPFPANDNHESATSSYSLDSYSPAYDLPSATPAQAPKPRPTNPSQPAAYYKSSYLFGEVHSHPSQRPHPHPEPEPSPEAPTPLSPHTLAFLPTAARNRHFATIPDPHERARLQREIEAHWAQRARAEDLQAKHQVLAREQEAAREKRVEAWRRQRSLREGASMEARAAARAQWRRLQEVEARRAPVVGREELGGDAEPVRLRRTMRKPKKEEREQEQGEGKKGEGRRKWF